jgi:hypothetical protein
MEHETVRMVAQSPFDYGKRALVAGDEFDCNPKHAKLLRIVGKAEFIEKETKSIPDLSKAPPEHLSGKEKRAYRRRDMRAE